MALGVSGRYFNKDFNGGWRKGEGVENNIPKAILYPLKGDYTLGPAPLKDLVITLPCLLRACGLFLQVRYPQRRRAALELSKETAQVEADNNPPQFQLSNVKYCQHHQ